MPLFMTDKEIEDGFHKITIMDVLWRKTEVEKKGGMSPGLAACFSRAIELLRSDPNVFYDRELILQGGGQFVAMHNLVWEGTHILWYDQHQKVVQEETVD